MFPTLPLARLKILYNFLDQDLEHTKEFLLQEFSDYHQPATKDTQNNKAVIQNNFSRTTPKYVFNTKVTKSVEFSSSLDFNILMHENNKDLENEYQLFSIYNKFLSNAKSSNNAGYISSYSSLRRASAKTIEYLRERAMYIAFRAALECKFKKVDLHYLYLEDAIKTLQIIIEYIKENSGSLERSIFSLEVVTGKGIHSKHCAVLYPEVQKYLKECGHRVVPGEGKLAVGVRL